MLKWLKHSRSRVCLEMEKRWINQEEIIAVIGSIKLIENHNIDEIPEEPLRRTAVVCLRLWTLLCREQHTASELAGEYKVKYDESLSAARVSGILNALKYYGAPIYFETIKPEGKGRPSQYWWKD